MKLAWTVLFVVMMAGSVEAQQPGMCKVFKEQGQLKSDCPYFHPISEPDWSMKLPQQWDGGTITLGSGRTWKIVENNGNELVNCTSDSLSSCRVVGLEKKLECHQRMQEAMRLMAPYIKSWRTWLERELPMKQHNDQWEATMKDCVN